MYYILGLLILVMITLLVMPFTLHFRAKEKNTYFEAEMSVMLFSCILFTRRWQGDCLKLLVIKLQRSKKEEKPKKHSRQKNNILSILLRICRWKRLNWNSEIGLDDASQTALTVGCVWGLQAILLQLCAPCKIEVFCRPNFIDFIIKNEILCIVTFSFGNIIKEIVGGYIKEKWRKAS